MGYVQEYEHALLNEDNVVFNVVVFESQPDATLLDIVKTDNHAASIISCDEYGFAVIGGSWNGEHFLDADGNRVPLRREPLDDLNSYSYDWDTDQWVAIGPSPRAISQNTQHFPTE
jgi:hypothetical protein